MSKEQKNFKNTVIYVSFTKFLRWKFCLLTNKEGESGDTHPIETSWVMFGRRATRQFGKLTSGVLKSQGIKQSTFANLFGEVSITESERQWKLWISFCVLV